MSLKHVFKIIFNILTVLLLFPSLTFAQEIGRNPFESPLEEKMVETKIVPVSLEGAEEIIEMTLTGIVTHEGRKAAIIDRKIVRVGDEIDKKRVILIADKMVVLISNGKKYILELKQKEREL